MLVHEWPPARLALSVGDEGVGGVSGVDMRWCVCACVMRCDFCAWTLVMQCQGARREGAADRVHGRDPSLLWIDDRPPKQPRRLPLP